MTAQRKCPTCGNAVAPLACNRAFPFCSDRCRLLDLGKWLGEEYRIPAGRPGDGAVLDPQRDPQDES